MIIDQEPPPTGPILPTPVKKTVLVVFNEWIAPAHPRRDGHWTKGGKIVEVERLTELNSMFERIVDVKILE